MKKGFKSKIVLCVTIFMLIFGFSACSSPSSDGGDTKSITVSMSISYPKEAKKENLDEFSMNVSEEATVLQVLEAYCEQEKIDIASDNSSGDPYVTSVNGVKATDSAGWVYEINDKPIMVVPSKQKIKNGDKIVWKFTSWQ